MTQVFSCTQVTTCALITASCKDIIARLAIQADCVVIRIQDTITHPSILATPILKRKSRYTRCTHRSTITNQTARHTLLACSALLKIPSCTHFTVRAILADLTICRALINSTSRSRQIIPILTHLTIGRILTDLAIARTRIVATLPRRTIHQVPGITSHTCCRIRTIGTIRHVVTTVEATI